MARSDKVPFRREFPFTESGILGDSNGMFVGDIKSLHLEFSLVTSYKLEGKVGRTDSWTSISVGVSDLVENIDLRPVEFIRLTVYKVEDPCRATLFGYEDDISKDTLTIKYNEQEEDRNIENNANIAQIVVELQKLNTYMSIITGEKI